MEDKSKYFVVKQKAVPEVLLKVVEAKKLLETVRAITVQEAADRVGISRSSFYKYKDDIFPFYDNTKGKTITLVVQMDDRQGLLSDCFMWLQCTGQISLPSIRVFRSTESLL